MPESILERAARAAQMARDEELGGGVLGPWGETPQRTKDEWHTIVRAVLAAIRDPSQGMVAYAAVRAEDPTRQQSEIGEAVAARLGGPQAEGSLACAAIVRDWQAMIDAALAHSATD